MLTGKMKLELMDGSWDAGPERRRVLLEMLLEKMPSMAGWQARVTDVPNLGCLPCLVFFLGRG